MGYASYGTLTTGCRYLDVSYTYLPLVQLGAYHACSTCDRGTSWAITASIDNDMKL